MSDTIKVHKIPIFQTAWESDILAGQYSTEIQYSFTLQYSV